MLPNSFFSFIQTLGELSSCEAALAHLKYTAGMCGFHWQVGTRGTQKGLWSYSWAALTSWRGPFGALPASDAAFGSEIETSSGFYLLEWLGHWKSPLLSFRDGDVLAGMQPSSPWQSHSVLSQFKRSLSGLEKERANSERKHLSCNKSLSLTPETTLPWTHLSHRSTASNY